VPADIGAEVWSQPDTTGPCRSSFSTVRTLPPPTCS
jgi:hypothetical protein